MCLIRENVLCSGIKKLYFGNLIYFFCEFKRTKQISLCMRMCCCIQICMTYKVRLCSYREILKEARQHEIRKCDVVLCTCASALKPEIREVMDFRQILIDECAMATEPEAFIPLVSYNPQQVSSGMTSSSSSSSSVSVLNKTKDTADSGRWRRLAIYNMMSPSLQNWPVP